MRYIASCSFGKDSLAMLLLLLEKNLPLDEVIFHDSGCEFQAVYTLIEKVKPLLKARGIKLTILKMRKSFEYMCFEHPIPKKLSGEIHKKGYGWCGGNCHWITAYKIRDIQRYMKDYGEYREYVGICYDEPERWNKCDRETRLLPLVDYKMSQKDCLQFCYDRGYSWVEDAGAGEIDLYRDLVDRVSCWCCRNKNLEELKKYYDKAPKYWNALIEMEKRIGEPMKKPRTLAEIEVFFKAGVTSKRKYDELIRKTPKEQLAKGIINPNSGNTFIVIHCKSRKRILTTLSACKAAELLKTGYKIDIWNKGEKIDTIYTKDNSRLEPYIEAERDYIR